MLSYFLRKKDYLLFIYSFYKYYDNLLKTILAEYWGQINDSDMVPPLRQCIVYGNEYIINVYKY